MAKYDDLDDDKPIVKDPDAENETFLTEMRERFRRSRDLEKDLREEALKDIKFTFVPGEQWDDWSKNLRSKRPCYEFNKVRQSVRQITGDQLQNRPAIRVLAVEDGDQPTAEVYEGLIRNIEAVSHAERAYDNGFQFSCVGGFGAWRVITDYASDDDFYQDIFIKPIANPFSVYFDPDSVEFDRRDARFCFVTEKISKTAFKEKYPDADETSFDGEGLPEDLLDWIEGDDLLICEYWYKERAEKKIGLLSSGEVVDMADFDAKDYAAQGITVKKERTVEYDKIVMEVVSGTQRLEGPHEWAGKFIPIVPVWGDLMNIDGRQVWSGMVRFAKDGQRLYNFEQSTLIELVAKQPQQPLTAPVSAIQGLESYYENLSDTDVPVLPYNADPTLPGNGKPERLGAPVFPAAWANLSAMASDNIKSTLGIYDASLGARSNETSGRAIVARQREGDVANFVYVDNLSKALKYTGEILIDLIPKIYDTERVMRILGQDGAQKWVQINKVIQDPRTGREEKINDLTQGKYSAVVSTGPSYTTQRQELADAAMNMAKTPGPLGLIWQLAYMENSDFPNAEKYVGAVRQFLVNQGLIQPQEGDQPKPPPQPNPKDIADAQLKAAQAQHYQAKTQETLATIDSTNTKNVASADELHAKALRNMQEAHHLETDRQLLKFVAPSIPLFSNAPTPGDSGGTYPG